MYSRSDLVEDLRHSNAVLEIVRTANQLLVNNDNL